MNVRKGATQWLTRWWTKYTFWKKGKITLKVNYAYAQNIDSLTCVGGVICNMIFEEMLPKIIQIISL